MQHLDILLYATGGICSFVVVVVIWRIVWCVRARRKKAKKQCDLLNQKVYINSDFQVPVTYHKIQEVNPWLRQKIPVVNVTEHTNHDSSDSSATSPSISSNRKSLLHERRKKISSHMISDLYKHSKYISPHDSSLSDDHLSIASLSDDGSVSSFEGSDDYGRNNYVSSNVYGVKKRLGRTRRRLGLTSHAISNRPSFKKSGKISFETEYNEEKKQLDVYVIKAMELAPKLNPQHLNPFVKVYLVPGKLQKQATHYKKATNEPEFNEKMTFINLEKSKMERHKLRIKVYNHLRMKRREPIGEVDIALVSLDLQRRELFNVDLLVKKSEGSQASCRVSLRHDAAESKLLVIVEEAKNLPKRKMTLAHPDSYIVARLYKEEKMEKQESDPVRNTRSPLYNEAFTFHIATDFEFPLSVFSLVITIANHNLIGQDEITGHVIFSLDSPQVSAASHWRAVYENPHEKHTRWHSLISMKDI